MSGRIGDDGLGSAEPTLGDSTAARVIGQGPDAVYRAKLDAGAFQIQHCGDCGSCQFYPRLLCRFCASARLRWIVPVGRGTVYSTTVVRREPAEGGDYNVAIVELDEGPRMMTRVDGVPADQVAIGMHVAARIIREEGAALLVFVADIEKSQDG